MQRRSCQVRLPLRPFRNRLQADAFFSGIIEFVLDDSEQSLIEFEESLDLCLVLGIQLFLLLDLLHAMLNHPLYLSVLPPHLLHPQ